MDDNSVEDDTGEVRWSPRGTWRRDEPRHQLTSPLL